MAFCPGQIRSCISKLASGLLFAGLILTCSCIPMFYVNTFIPEGKESRFDVEVLIRDLHWRIDFDQESFSKSDFQGNYKASVAVCDPVSGCTAEWRDAFDSMEFTKLVLYSLNDTLLLVDDSTERHWWGWCHVEWNFGQLTIPDDIDTLHLDLGLNYYYADSLCHIDTTVTLWRLSYSERYEPGTWWN